LTSPAGAHSGTLHENWNSVVCGQLFYSLDKFPPPLGNKAIPTTPGSFTVRSRGMSCVMRSCPSSAEGSSASGSFTNPVHPSQKPLILALPEPTLAISVQNTTRQTLTSIALRCHVNSLPDVPVSHSQRYARLTQAHHRIFLAECKLERI